MRLIFIFSPAFYEWPKAIIKELKKRDANTEIIALATTRQIYDRLTTDDAYREDSFYLLDCLEDKMKEWVAGDYDAKALKSYEALLGTDIVNNILIADRQVGQGFITCADPVKTGLTLMTANHDRKRAYIAGTIAYCLQLVDEHAPEGTFFYAVADANSVALTEVLALRGIPALRLAHTRIDNRYLIDPDPKALLQPVYGRLHQSDMPGEESLGAARKWLYEFRDSSDKEPDYMTYLRHFNKKTLSPLGIGKRFAHSLVRLALYGWLKGEKPITTETGWQRLRDSVMIPYKYYKTFRATNYTPLAELEGKSFIYYTLHVDPEASTMHLAPQYTNQHAVIEAIAKQKPLSIDLVVKEHPNMIGKRPAGFYERILALPGVYMVDPGIPSQLLVKRAALVTTITGTVCWEALVLGKPVLTLGETPYGKVAVLRRGMVRESNLAALKEAIAAALKLGPVTDDDLLTYLGTLFEESFSLSSSLIWQNNSAADVSANSDVTKQIVDQIFKRLACPISYSEPELEDGTSIVKTRFC